jgi:peptide/nickel transport system permease protein
VVSETIFTIPGIGTLVVNSVMHRDFSVVQGVVLFTTVVFVLVNLVVDILYGVFDPRVGVTAKK